MLILNCTSCGAEVRFLSKASVFAVCSFCRSTLLRQDMNLEAIGKIAFIQDDFTPLQIGTKGKYREKNFEIAGRLKVSYDEGFWNEWYLVFTSGAEEGWLAEAQGFYAVCFPGRAEGLASLKRNLNVGDKFKIDGEGVFEIEDFRDVACVFSEGELPLRASQGRKSTSVDLTAPGKKMATIEFAEDETRLFVGSYCDFDELQFRNLRSIDGWT